MHTLWYFLTVEHPAASAAFGTWLLGNICSTMPSPNANSGLAYRWIFSFASVVGSALPRTVPNLRLGQSNPTTVAVPGSPSVEPTVKNP